MSSPPKKTFTIVTAFFDINRSNWDDIHKRDTQLYMYYFSFILNMDVNMCIYTEEKFVDFINHCRTGFADKTKIIITSLDQLCMYKYKDTIQTIMDSDEYKKNQKDPECPEVKRPKYNIVVNSKVELVYKTSVDNPFNTQFFIWMDAGYGHGTLNIPKRFKFYPESFMQENKISVCCLKNNTNLISTNYKTFYEEHIDVIMGGFFCGDKKSLEKYNIMFYTTVEDCISQNITDDDQYTICMCYIKNVELFNVFYDMSWYKAIERFHKD